MEFQGRPLGVVILSGSAFPASFGLVFLVIKAFILIRANVPMPLFEVEPTRRFSVIVAPGFFYVSLVVLACISFVAGRDLLRLRARGRSLTLTSMSMICVFSGLMAFQSFGYSDSAHDTSAAVCIFSAGSVLYLFLPSVKRRFQHNPA